MNSKALVAGAALLVTIAPARAQTPNDAAALFGARPAFSGASLSPDGKSIAYLAADAGRGTSVMIAAAAGGTAPRAIIHVDGRPMKIGWCDWADNARLVCGFYGSALDHGLRVGFQRLLSIPVDGSGEAKLLSQIGTGAERLRASQYDGDVIDWNQGETGKLLMMRDHVPESDLGTHLARTADGMGVDLVDARTLAATRIETPDPNAVGYISDGKGNVRMKATLSTVAGGFMQGTTNWYYRKAGDRVWIPFSQVDVNDHGLRPQSIDPVANTAYALDTQAGRAALFRVALDGSMARQLVYADPRADVDSVVRLGRQARLIGAQTTADLGNVVYFDPEYRTLAAQLSKALPHLPQIEFVGSDDAERQLLLSAGSDDDAGRYFLFDKGTKRLNEVALAYPALEKMPLAKMRLISFKAADGTVIPAYLTLPPGGDGKNLPAIVMPHGGPASHDSWGYDWLVQFFAHQGYAVLQPEFRGSTGYGDAWLQKNGFQSWRTAIGDVVDSGRWLLAQGIAAPGKLAILGWSYGGYAALQSNVVAPDLFKAVVAIAPVTDFTLLKQQASRFTNAGVVADYIGSGSWVSAGSPARHAEAFQAPVLMFHGTVDDNVDYSESRLMEDRLRAAGKSVELVTYDGLDHQLPDGQSRADMLRRSDAFLRKTMALPPAP